MRRFSFAFRSKKTPAQHGRDEKANAAIAQPTDSASPAEDQQFRAAERERTRAFLLAEQQRELDFLEAEASRRKPDEARNEEFKQFLADDTKSFGEIQKARELAFIEQEMKQEEFFKEKEEARNSAFEAVQEKREEAFQSSQERRLRRAKWYSTQREEVSRKGRAKRDTQFEAFVGDLQRQFDQFLRTETDSWIQLQNQRKVNAGNKIASAGDPNLSSPPMANDIGHDSPTDDGIQSDEENGVPMWDRLVNLSCATPPFASPVEISEGVLQRRSRSSSLCRAPTQLCPIIIQAPSGSGSMSSVQDIESIVPIPSQPILGFQNQPPTYNESDFQLKQEERERIFKEGQQIRGDKFREGEKKRESAHRVPQRGFDEHIYSRNDLFRKAQVAFHDSFTHHQRSRDQGADIRRGCFDAFLLRIQGTFEQDLLWFAERYRAEKKSLDAEDNARDNQVARIFFAMQKQVHDTLENLKATILDHNATYSFETSFLRPSNSVDSLVSEAGRTYSDIPPPRLPPPVIIPACNPPVIPFYFPRPTTDPAPELLFVPQTLFQQAMGTMFTTPLPITGEVKSKTAISMGSLTKRSQIQSDAAERQRKALYQFEVEQYHYQFTVNEHRRQTQFKDQLEQCRSIVENQNSEWTREFMISQGSRLQQFYEAETASVESEVAAVVEREKRFAEAQERRTKAFHELQETLQEKCVHAESTSQSTFDGLMLARRKQFDTHLNLWKGQFIHVSTTA